MGFVDAVVWCFKNYVNFFDRAPRSEFWYWILFNCSVMIGLGVIGGIHLIILDDMNADDMFIKTIMTIATIFKLATIVPSIAVCVRRLHDTDRSGWWMFIAATIVGVIPLIFWYCSKGTDGENAYGDDPLT